MSFLTRDAALMPEQRGSIALDRGERAAQFMAHCSQQFGLEQLHLLERSVFQSRFQFVDTSGQQDVHLLILSVHPCHLLCMIVPSYAWACYITYLCFIINEERSQ